MTDRFLHNPSRGEIGDALRSTREPQAFHRRLENYAPTPLLDARGIAAALGVRRVLVKNESSRLGLPSFKLLGASWASSRQSPPPRSCPAVAARRGR